MIRYALRGLLIAGLLLVLTIMCLFVLAQTPTGKRFITTQVSSALSTPESGIQIEGLDGWLPVSMRLDRLSLADRDGVWLEAEGILAAWSPLSLFRGRLQIDVVQAERLHLTRLPVAADDADEVETDDTPFRLPELPDTLPVITLDTLSVPEIILEAPVLGEAARFQLDGSLTASQDGRHADLTFDIQRLDQATAFLTLTSVLSLDPPALAVDLDAAETGELLARLTGHDTAGDLDFALSGNGPLDDWSGTLDLQAGGLGRTNAALTLALVDEPRLGIDMTAHPAEGWLPANMQPLIEAGLGLKIAATQTRAQAISIEQLDLKSDGFGLTSAGQVDFNSGDLVYEATLEAPDLTPLSPLFDTALQGGASAELQLEGTIEQPQGKLELHGNELGLDGMKLQELAASLNWAATGLMADDDTAIIVTTEGTAAGLTIPDTPLPDDRATWQAALDVPLEGSIEIRDAEIETAGAILQTGGQIDPQTLIGDLQLALKAPTLSSLVMDFGVAIDGDALIEAAVTTTEGAQTIDVDLKAAINDLANLPDGAKELVGRRLDLTTSVALAEQRDLDIRDLVLEGDGIRLGGNLALNLESQAVDGEIKASVPALAPLSDLIGQPITGALDLETTIGGALDAPTAEIRLASERIDIADDSLESLLLTLSGNQLATAPEGKLALDLVARSLPLTLALDYRLENTQLALSDIRLIAPETALGGALAVDLDKTLIDGALGGTITDLAALESLHQQPLQGALKLDGILTHDAARQNADIALSLERLQGDFGQVNALKVNGSLEDLLGKPSVSATTDVTGFRQGETTIDRLTLQSDGDLGQLRLDLDMDGTTIQPLTLAATGDLSLTDGLMLKLGRLDGAFAGESIALAKPLTFEQAGDRLSLADLDLRLGAATLTGALDIDPARADGRIDLAGLPLAWLERFDGPVIDGAAQASINLAGSGQDPAIDIAIDVNDINANDLTDKEIPEADIVMRAALEAGKFGGQLTATGLTETPIEASIALPVTLSLAPFALDMPEDGALEGDIEAVVQLSHIGDILALDQQILRGRLAADVTLGGTLAAPVIDGPITLENGGYENDQTGTVLRDLTLDAGTSKERVTINTLAGLIGEEGTLGAEGWMSLDAEQHLPFSFTVTLEQAEVLATDDMEAILSGDIALLGDMSAPVIEGDLTVNRAEIFLPDSGGPSLPDIDIEEIGNGIVNTAREKEEQAPAVDPKLAMAIDLPNKIYVRGRGLESEWLGNLDVTGTTSAPRVTGDLEVKTGYFDFIEKRFEIDEGVITFNGASPPDPTVAIEASTTEDDFTAIIKITGTTSDPDLTLESEPTLPEDEVLARLLFDRELSEIGVVEAGKLALAINKLRSGGGGGFDAFGEIRDALNIDTLDVVSDDEGDSKVKAGKYLSDEVYFEVERGSAEESGRARVEIEIHPNVSIEADTGEDANGGVGLKWRFNY